jgi:serine/threonine-protein kinase
VAVASYVIASRSDLPGFATPLLIGATAIAWCIPLVACSMLISRVIYGLHREIESVRRLGQYVLGDLIGEGGMGSVYRAEHALLRRPTAIKLLLPDRTGPDNLLRFEREVQRTAQLAHPNTVAVYDYGRTAQGVFYYAMELLDGITLQELVDRFGPQPAGRVVHILDQAAGALAEAHGLGLIHRDIKPANILFCERGGLPDVIKVVDFGLVKNLARTDPALTHADALIGTPLYMAPESINDPAAVDAGADLYALGGVGYFLVAGRPPFEGTSAVQICGQHLHSKPPAPSQKLGAPVPAGLEALLLSCLAKSKLGRPSSAEALREALADCARESPWSLAEARDWWRAFRRRDSEDGNAAPARRD